MSSLLLLNNMPNTWKGRTFNQIHSSIQKNGQLPVTEWGTLRNIFSANPLKIYRREVASTLTDTCASRASIKIDIFNRPNGTINNTTASEVNDLVNIIDNTLPNNSCEKYENCSVILSPAANARNRVRSSGMIKRKFNVDKNNDTYYTSSSQYLSSRNRTFAQNQYNYIRVGDSAAKPGTNLASANVYVAAGVNRCAKYHVSANTVFSYIWIDSTTRYNVSIPIGDYSTEDLNRLFKMQMFENQHYFIKDSEQATNVYYSSNISYPLNIAFNNNDNVFELHTYRMDETVFPPTNYKIPTNPENTPFWTIPVENGIYPQFVIYNNTFRDAVGFTTGVYPLSNDTDIDKYKVAISSYKPGIRPSYVKLFYKPNNPQFAQQGGVSASDLITRKKYNSITNSTAAYRTAFGGAVANALAYGVPSNGYTVKDKLGYPIKKTPTFSKYTDDMKQCPVTSFANAI